MTTDIIQNLQRVRARIQQCCAQQHRDPEQVQLLAVSKKHSVAAIRMAYAAKQRHFGENYLQEAVEKIQALTDTEITWHFIGHIQTNKTALIAQHFDWVHSVDRIKIAQRLSQQRPADLPPLNICLQVNIDNEPNKSGFAVDEVHQAIAQIHQLPHLKLRGLMSIPKPQPNPDLQRQAHEKLATLGRTAPVALETLSMGMSQDLDAAIAAGATWVRVGTDIFGPRYL